MKYESATVTIKDLVEDYIDNLERGVSGYNGYLNIRPAYQREFVYKDRDREEVINTINKNGPLGLFHWVEKDGKYEMLDGQQRTISICQYVTNVFSVNEKLFANLQEEEQKHILDYEIRVEVCSGTNREKLEWFKIINIAGVSLTNQELININYIGPWLTNAKLWFSKTNCQAHSLYAKYMKGTPIRQDYLETALKWISKESVTGYMGEHQHDSDAKALWDYFENVMHWVKQTFPKYRKEMKGVQWGLLYNQFKDTKLPDFEDEIKRLMMDDDVTKKAGIYTYVLTLNESALSVRAFTDKIKTEVYETQDGHCKRCDAFFAMGNMEADHITPFSEGGHTTRENCQMLCKRCNRTKSNK